MLRILTVVVLFLLRLLPISTNPQFKITIPLTPTSLFRLGIKPRFFSLPPLHIRKQPSATAKLWRELFGVSGCPCSKCRGAWLGSASLVAAIAYSHFVTCEYGHKSPLIIKSHPRSLMRCACIQLTQPPVDSACPCNGGIVRERGKAR
jgi:hypothetical protein